MRSGRIWHSGNGWLREINVLLTDDGRWIPDERNKSAGRTNRGRGRAFALPSSCYAYLNIYLSGVAGARIHRAWRRDEFMHFARDNCTSAAVRSSFALPEEMRSFFRRWKTALHSLFVSVSARHPLFPFTESLGSKLHEYAKIVALSPNLTEKKRADKYTIRNKVKVKFSNYDAQVWNQ